MRSKALRLISVIIVFLLLIPMVVACKKNGDENSDTEISTENGRYQNPVEVIDLGGKEYTFMTTLWYNYEPLNYVDIAPEGMTGDFVVDASFERLSYIQETYNCKIVQVDCPTKEMLHKLETNTMAGDEAYDFTFLRGLHYIAAINGGYLAQISEFDIDTSASWWDQNAIDTLTINKQNYGIIGDVTINHLMAVGILCFNKDMIAEHNLESPYDMVENGTWTFERVMRIAKNFAADNDGIDGMSKKDLWGANYTRDIIVNILAANNIKIITKNADGVPELTIGDYQGKVYDIFVKLFDETYCADTLNPLCLAEKSDTEIFDDEKCLFLFTATHNATALRNSNVKYGVVPYPKANDEGNYISSTAGNYLAIMSIPATNIDYHNAGVFLDAYAAFGQAKVRPMYYDNILLNRVSGQDMESYDMMKYIFENLTYDIGTVYDVAAMDIMDASKSLDVNFSGLVGANRLIWKTELKELLKAFGVK